jgi:hypothetical protein
MKNPAGTILEVALSLAVPRCLQVIAEVGIADALGDSRCSAGELAYRTGVDAGMLARMLRLVSAFGIFAEHPDGFEHTSASRLLRSDHPNSMRSFVRMTGLPIVWKSFEELTHAIRDGEPASGRVFPGGIWAYMAEHPAESAIFDDAMTARAHSQIPAIVASYDFSQFSSIADIGGGRGHLLQSILVACPGISGVLFDLPHVLERLPLPDSSRLRYQPGDLFSGPLPQCDAYVMMQVVHNWNDSSAVQVLRSVRRAANDHSRLLLIEGIVPDVPVPRLLQLSDIFMLAMFNGRERSRKDFDALLNTAGFRLERVIDVGLGTSIMEALPQCG